MDDVPDLVTTERVSRYIELAASGDGEGLEYLRAFILETIRVSGPQTLVMVGKAILQKADQYCQDSMFNERKAV